MSREGIDNFAEARRSKDLSNERHNRLMNLYEKKKAALDDALEKNDEELINKRIKEYKAFILEMKFTDSEKAQDYEDMGLEMEARILTRMHNKKSIKMPGPQPIPLSDVQRQMDEDINSEANSLNQKES